MNLVAYPGSLAVLVSSSPSKERRMCVLASGPAGTNACLHLGGELALFWGWMQLCLCICLCIYTNIDGAVKFMLLIPSNAG